MFITAPVCAQSDSRIATEVETNATEPAHFIFFGLDRDRIRDNAFLETESAAGAQLKYTWAAEGRFCMTKITLRPVVRFGGDSLPAPNEIQALHEKSHRNCIIANSLKSEIVVEFAGSDVTV